MRHLLNYFQGVHVKLVSIKRGLTVFEFHIIYSLSLMFMPVLFQSWVHLILTQRMHPDRVQRETGADLPVDVAGERRTTGI